MEHASHHSAGRRVAVRATVVGPVGCQEIVLDIRFPHAGRGVVLAELHKAAPDFRSWDAVNARDLAQMGRPDRTWVWEGEVAPEDRRLAPGWLLVGLTPGEYALSLVLGDGARTLFETNAVVHIKGVLVDAVGPPAITADSIVRVEVQLQPYLNTVVNGASLEISDARGCVIAPISFNHADASTKASLDDLTLCPGVTSRFAAEIHLQTVDAGVLYVTVYDAERRLIGRGLYRYLAVPSAQAANSDLECDRIGHPAIPSWAYGATISKIYNPVDIDVIAKVLEESRQHGVSVFSWETHKAEHFEALDEIAARAAGNGIRTLAYTGALGLEEDSFLQRYPETSNWVIRNRVGDILKVWHALSFSPVSPYFDQYRAPIFRYLARVLDGVFADISNIYSESDYSNLALESFAKTYPDIDPVALTPSDPNYPLWIEWRYESVAEVARRAKRHMRSVRRDSVLSWNMAATIGRLTWSHDYALDAVRLGSMVDAPLVESNYVEGEPLWVLGANARYYADCAPGKPIWVALRFEYPGGETFSPAQVEATMAEIYANGASAYIDWQPVSETLQGDQAFLAAVDRMFRFVREHSDLFVDADTRSAAQVAMVYSRQTNDYWKNPMGRSANADYQAEFLGWYQVLLEAGVQADIVAHEALDDTLDLGRYKAVILPCVATLSDRQVANIRKYVAAGGHVVSASDTGQGDPWGKPVAGLLERLSIQAPAAPKGPVALNIDKGRLVYAPGGYGRLYWDAGETEARSHMQIALDACDLQDCRVAWVVGADDDQVEAVAHLRSGDMLLVHLVNWNTNLGDWYASSHAFQHGDRNYQAITEIRPIHNVTLIVRLPAGRRGRDVHWATVGGEKTRLTFQSHAEGRIGVTIPKLGSLGVLSISLSDEREVE